MHNNYIKNQEREDDFKFKERNNIMNGAKSTH